MKVVIAYLCVVLVWSTTPLAVVWSNSSLSFVAAVSARMVFACIISLVLLKVFKKALFTNRNDWKVYAAGGLALYPNMMLVYWSAQYIPSGLISVIFGMSPFIIGVLSISVLKENPFTPARVFALIIAVLGLAFIHFEQFSVGEKAVYGVLGIAMSALMFGFSIVLLKRVGGNVEPIRQLSGSMLFAAPLYLLTWCVMDGEIPQHVDMRSLFGVSYLVILGSIVGGMAFYYVLKHCDVSSVALIPLMTPVNALVLGYIVEGDTLKPLALIGSVLILASLGIYQGLVKIVYRRIKSLCVKKESVVLVVE